MAVIVLLCLLLFGYSRFCESRVTIYTQPKDAAVRTGGVAMFSCVVNTASNPNSDDIMWKRYENMGNFITLTNENPYMIKNDFINQIRLNSTLTITNVRLEHTGFYQFAILGDVMSRNASLTILTATILTQPSDVTVCTSREVVFTCVLDRNSINEIDSDDVVWQQIRMINGAVSRPLESGMFFNITTTISGDILTSTLTITGVTDSNVLGASLYRCGVQDSDVMSRNASISVVTGPPGTPMNIRFSDITNKSFVIQWDEVDDVDKYVVNWRGDSGSISEATTQRTSRTITRLSPNTTYAVTVTAVNICGSDTVSDILIVTTDVTILVGPSISSSVMTTTSTITPMHMPSTTPAVSSSVGGGDSSASSDGGGGGAGGIIGGVVGGIIAVIVVIIIIVVLYWFCVYKKKGGADLEKETYAALKSPTGSFAKDTFPESHYDAVGKPGTRVVPDQSSAGGVEYAVSTKTASMASLNEPPPEYAYAAVDKKKHIVASIPHQSSATGVQYAVSTKAAEAKEPHRYDEIRDEPGDVPHQTSTSGAEYAVSTKATGHQYDDVKDKSPAPQGINYAEIQHEPTPGMRVVLDNDPVVHYTQVS